MGKYLVADFKLLNYLIPLFCQFFTLWDFVLWYSVHYDLSCGSMSRI